MHVDTTELSRLSALSDAELLTLIGDKVLSQALGAAEASDSEKKEEGQRIVEELKPVTPGFCGHPLVQAFITGTNTELTTELIAAVGDVSYHAILPVPVLTLTVAFIRFGMRKYCAHQG